MIFHILYLSSAVKRFDDSELAELLKSSRRNNSDLGVTGLMLYADGNFIQYLEGEPDAVRGLFAKINRDPQHHGILTVSEDMSETRIFADWSMGFHTLTPNEQKLLGQFDFTRAVLDAKINPEMPVMLQSMMRNFYVNTNHIGKV